MIIIVIAMLGMLSLLMVMLMVFKIPINFWMLGRRFKISKEEAAQVFKDWEPQFYSYDSTGKIIKENNVSISKPK